MKILLLLFPFISFYSLADIFEHLQFYPPRLETHCTVTSATSGPLTNLIGSSCNVDATAYCKTQYTDQESPIGTATYYNNTRGEVRNFANNGGEVWCIRDRHSFSNYQWNLSINEWDHGNFQGTDSTIKACPPNDFPYFTYPYDVDEDGEIDRCYSPTDIDLADSCNSSSQYQQLEFTAGGGGESGCYALPDGSMCYYNAVSVGSGGSKIFEMSWEDSCYHENPTMLTPGTTLSDPPPYDTDNGYKCVADGGLMSCAADPDEMCPSGDCTKDTGTEYSCGYRNGSFVCVDTDTDGDGLPDYNDPDIDGDGIRNQDDLDSNGDGIDDPVNPNGGSSDSSGNTTVNIDTSGIINAINQTNNKLDTLNDNFKTDHGQTPKDIDDANRLTDLNDQFQSDVDGLITSTAGELGFIDELSLTNGDLAALAPVDGCQAYQFTDKFSLDLCLVSAKTNPILYWLFAVLTVFYIFIRVNETLRLR